MEKSGAKRLWAGIFFIVGLILIVVAVFVVGLDKGWSQPKTEVIVLFNRVGGLVEGAPIRISGVNVGIVGSVDFLNEPIKGRSLKVVLVIYKKYERQLFKCARVSIKTEGVLGQKLIEMSEDSKLKPLDMTSPVLGEDPLDVEDMAGVITRTALSLQETSKDVDVVVEEWKYISKKSRRILNRFEEKLIEGDLFKIF